MANNGYCMIITAGCLQENIRANLCKLLEAHPSVINIKVCAWYHSCST
jgi:2C-methyl-D-erythritol 2,4-cyclodiphosphate synthase